MRGEGTRFNINVRRRYEVILIVLNFTVQYLI